MARVGIGGTVGGGSEGWLRDVESAISGTGAAQAMRAAQAKKAQQELEQPEGMSNFEKLKNRLFPPAAALPDPTDLILQGLEALNLQSNVGPR